MFSFLVASIIAAVDRWALAVAVKACEDVITTTVSRTQARNDFTIH